MKRRVKIDRGSGNVFEDVGFSPGEAENLLARQFAAGGLNAWLADMTQIRCQEGWLYLAVVQSLRSREVLGWSTGVSPDSQLALRALKLTAAKQKPRRGQLHNSDRGSVYTSREYLAQVERLKLVPSMSRKGNCYDNAVIESFFASLKRELPTEGKLPTRRELRRMLFEYIEVHYNRTRLHSALGYMSPERFEQLNPVLN